MISDDELAADAAAPAEHVDREDKLTRIRYFAECMINCQAKVKECEDNLEKAKQALREVEQTDLPELMREVGLEDFRLANGMRVSVVDDVHCGVSEERKPAAHRWLEQHGFGGLIKTAVAVDFGRDRDAAVRLAEELANKLGFPVDVKEGVHPSTLKSFIKERMAAGEQVPFDTFAIQPFVRAKITKK